jgi:hypothetical protein
MTRVKRGLFKRELKFLFKTLNFPLYRLSSEIGNLSEWISISGTNKSLQGPEIHGLGAKCEVCCRGAISRSSFYTHQAFPSRRLLSPNSPTLQIWPLQTFFLFPRVKSTFQAIDDTEENSLRDLCAIRQNVFQDAFQN